MLAIPMPLVPIPSFFRLAKTTRTVMHALRLFILLKFNGILTPNKLFDFKQGPLRAKRVIAKRTAEEHGVEYQIR